MKSFFSWSWWMDSNCCWEAFWQGFGFIWETEWTNWRVIWGTTDLSYWPLLGKGTGPKFGKLSRFFLDVFSPNCSKRLIFFVYVHKILQLVLRFANRFFLPLWNRDNIANVQVSIFSLLFIVNFYFQYLLFQWMNQCPKILLEWLRGGMDTYNTIAIPWLSCLYGTSNWYAEILGLEHCAYRLIEDNSYFMGLGWVYICCFS